ncbi:MAG: ABC transporter permease [Acidimicrobiales bacterium]|nr:ABC transporter permease [Acidimicrobiales bacterium]
MLRYILRRVVYSVITLLLLSVTIFLIVRATGDPARTYAGPEASEEEVALIRAEYGLDRPLLAQYGSFVGDIVTGDLGRSFQYRQPVLDVYLDRLPRSLLLASLAFTLSLAIGIPAGVLSAVRSGSWAARAFRAVALTGVSIPNFVIATALIFVFSVKLGWLPTSGSGSAKQLVMPTIALGWYFAAATMRLTQSSMLEVMRGDYVKLARLKGVPERLVILKHALKNALIPVLTLAAVNFVVMVNVAVVIEQIFAWPGIGDLVAVGISMRDFPLVQGVVLMAGAMVVTVNFVLDVVYAWLDPRIRLNR